MKTFLDKKTASSVYFFYYYGMMQAKEKNMPQTWFVKTG